MDDAIFHASRKLQMSPASPTVRGPAKENRTGRESGSFYLRGTSRQLLLNALKRAFCNDGGAVDHHPLVTWFDLAGYRVGAPEVVSSRIHLVLEPPASAGPAEVPLLHLAALIALEDGVKAGLSPEGVIRTLPQIAAAAYVRLALGELAERRWEPTGVSALHCSRLSQCIKQGDGKALIEQHLGMPGADTKRFACFSPSNLTMCDFPLELYQDLLEGPLVIVDSWGIAR